MRALGNLLEELSRSHVLVVRPVHPVVVATLDRLHHVAMRIGLDPVVIWRYVVLGTVAMILVALLVVRTGRL